MATRTLYVSLASVLALALVIAGVWWGVRSSAATADNEPAAATLLDGTQMGAVELLTADLAPMRTYYVNAVGLEVLQESSDRLSLGREGTELLSIVHAPERAADTPANAGLYHSALLYPTEKSLASVLMSIATAAPQSYSGSADHSVSLAFYFQDPDGNGLELYTDTPEESWEWKDGLVTMGAAPLDPNAFIQEHLGSAAASEGSGTDSPTMGHVHLRVGDLEQARAFYADTLGFAVTATSDGALFYAAGGYHHHLATNTWSSANAAERPESLGLGSLTVRLTSEAELVAATERLTDAGLGFTQDGGMVTVNDPWGNTVRLLA